MINPFKNLPLKQQIKEYYRAIESLDNPNLDPKWNPIRERTLIKVRYMILIEEVFNERGEHNE